MANLNQQSFSSIVSNFATAVQGACASLIDFTKGSVLLAVGQATSGVALWLQGLILQAMALTRAATSSGPDLDSFFSQFGWSREAAVVASGQETFGRYTPTNQADISPGATVTSSDGTVIFTVIADTTNANYNAPLGYYIIPVGQASAQITVQCSTAGTIGNLALGALNTLGTAIPGVDYVTNAAAFSNGVAAQSDSAARVSFVLWIASLEAATFAAVMNAITSVGQNITGVILENTQYNGSAQTGYFTVIADDGTGSPSSTTLANVSNAVESARPLTVTYGVHAPTLNVAAVSMAIATASGYVHSAVVALVEAALQSYINGLGDDVMLPWSMLATTAYTVAGVTNVTGVLLNGSTADLTPTTQQRITAGTIVVT